MNKPIEHRPVRPNVLGNMIVMADPPPKMWKALATIADRAHPAYDECSGFPPGTSFDKCLFMSLAVRDFLVEIGFIDATVRGCALFIGADDPTGKQIWSVGVGIPGQDPIEGKFNGHAVCTVPSLDLLIDTTMYQTIRPQWKGAVSGMAAIKYHSPWRNQMIHGRPSIAGAEVICDDRRVTIAWLDRPELKWKRDIDFRVRNDRRRFVTKALREAFDPWTD